MKNKSLPNHLITYTPAFDESNIKPGSLIIVHNNAAQLIGTGVVMEVNPLELKIALYTNSDSSRHEIFGQFENLISYRLSIVEVIEETVSFYIIDPESIR